MGTRHLIAVALDGKYKVAQYGQWDGYPSGQGKTILEFLRKVDLNAFREKVARLRWLTKADIAKVDKTPNWPTVYPHLSRDAGAKVLDLIMASEEPLRLQNSISFAGDGLFCEWAYVIDLDKGVLEVFSGFSKDRTPAESRFPSGADWLNKSDYAPVRLVTTFMLAGLPTDETFFRALEPVEQPVAA